MAESVFRVTFDITRSGEFPAMTSVLQEIKPILTSMGGELVRVYELIDGESIGGIEREP